MKAPEKIKIGKYNITSDGDVLFAWVTNTPDCEAIQHDVEYIRADTFIKKACDWLKEQDEMIGVSFQEDFLERFKAHMKGE